MKMEKVVKFGYIEIQKQKFHQHIEPISIKNIDMNKIVVFNKVSFDNKSFKVAYLVKINLFFMD